MKKIKIALVDDHQLFREGISEIIKSFPNFTVTLEASNGAEFIDRMNSKNMPNIVLLDINMKGMDGFQTASWIKTNHPTIKTIALSMYEDEATIIRMLRCGACGYVPKDIRKQELFDAITYVSEKGYYHSELITGRLIHSINSMDEKKKNGMSEFSAINQKELEFLRLVCSELTYKEIADKMGLSPHTIDGYRDSLFEKLNLRSRVGLVLYAIKKRIFMIE